REGHVVPDVVLTLPRPANAEPGQHDIVRLDIPVHHTSDLAGAFERLAISHPAKPEGIPARTLTHVAVGHGRYQVPGHELRHPQRQGAAVLEDVAEVRALHVAQRHVPAPRPRRRRLVPVEHPDDVGVAELGEDGHLARGRGALRLALDGDALDGDELPALPAAAQEDLAEGPAAQDPEAVVVGILGGCRE
ncbi:hypothetical protein THAOC_28214, partial [Thalassiosira oceanica]